jgi:cell division protein FtsB
MNKLYLHRHILKNNVLTFFGVCLCMYFSFHAVHGDRGVLRLVSANTQLETLSIHSDNLSAQRAELERKVAMMRPGSVDKDLLEERVRSTLGYKHADEYAILSH